MSFNVNCFSILLKTEYILLIRINCIFLSNIPITSNDGKFYEKHAKNALLISDAWHSR